MEAFESFVALSMSKEGLVVSGPLKFTIKKRPRRPFTMSTKLTATKLT